MALTTLAVTDFRNLETVELSLAPGLNLIEGPNGAGKTSLLEAVYFLGRGKSFRTHKLHHLIRKGSDRLRVVGRLGNEAGELVVGIERDRQRQRIRIGGQPARSLAQLVSHFPLQILDPDSHMLLEGGPKYRRRFLDWGVFHVEHAFLGHWQRFLRALRQRNVSLRARAPAAQVRLWDEEIIRTTNAIDGLRADYIQKFQQVFADTLPRLLDVSDLEIRYRPGWPAKVDFPQALGDGLEKDRALGYTRYGPHRAELAVLRGGTPVHEAVSRGQQKLIVTAMLLAQASLYQAQSGKACFILVDDLPSELDAEHRARFMEILASLRAQVFVSAIDGDQVPRGHWPRGKRFHVEHGSVTEVVY